MRFPRQKYWSGFTVPSPGNLPDPGMEPGSPALQADSFPSEPPGKRSKLTGINRKLRCHYMLCVAGVNREIYATVYSGASNIHMHHSNRPQSKRVCSDGRLQNHCTKQFHQGFSGDSKISDLLFPSWRFLSLQEVPMSLDVFKTHH